MANSQPGTSADPPLWPAHPITTAVVNTAPLWPITSPPSASSSPSSLMSEPTVGQMLRFLRRRARLSQAALARLLGYSQQQVSLWEHDRHPLSSGVHRQAIEALLSAQEARELRRQQLIAAMRQYGVQERRSAD